ncbi:MAG TPA: GNVR domain-containing protein [Vicinamibacterales bacterium]|nr:GNVR domain-containing protein [Vicinamibacterales bacterium]
MDQQSFHPLDYLSVANRRKWWFIVPLITCIALGGAVVAVWPKKYLSKAAIGMQSPTLSPDLLRGVSSMDPSERQRAVQQLLLSPTVLERVIREEQINPKSPAADVALWLRDNLARNIEVPPPIGLNGRPDPTRGIDLFYIGYTDRDPARAQRITNRVATVFVEENSKFQTIRAENSADVLEQQLNASQARLNELENKLRGKKQNYIGRLPEQIGANVQMVNGARTQFESISMQIRAEQDRLSLIEGQLDQMRQGVGAESMTTAAIAASQASQKRVDDLESQLASARALGYKDKHPEIERLQAEIKQARADLSASREQAPSNREELLKADPLYRQKLTERDMTRLRIRELQNASASAQRQIGEYQSRVEAAPVVEQELASLTRDYNAERDRYADLTTRLNNARVAEDVARKQGGERFSILYPAFLPDTPIEPQPLKIMGVALVAGLVLGAIAALGREFLDRSVHDSRALQSEFEVPVLGEIPRITA